MVTVSKIVLALMTVTLVAFVSARPGGKQMTEVLDPTRHLEKKYNNNNLKISRSSRSEEPVEVEKAKVQSEVDETTVSETNQEVTEETVKDDNVNRTKRQVKSALPYFPLETYTVRFPGLKRLARSSDNVTPAALEEEKMSEPVKQADEENADKKSTVISSETFTPNTELDKVTPESAA